MPTTIHHGEGIKCYREIKGMKQEVLAEKLGSDWTQKKVSLLEGKENIEDEILQQVAKALEVPVEAIKNFSREGVIQYITNHFNDHSSNQGSVGVSNHCTFNPLDKLMEVMDENKKLYERLLQAEKEKVELLERMVGKK